MKRDMDTMTISLNDEKLYLQILRSFHENTDKWHQWRHVPHSHTVYELHFILRGCCRLTIDGCKMDISAGQAVLIAPEKYHEPFSEDGEFERLSFFFMPDKQAGSIQRVLTAQVGDYIIFPATTSMLDMGRVILRDWNESGPFRKEMRQAMFTSLMILVFRHLGIANKMRTEVGREPPRMFLCDDYFTDPTEKKSIADLAEYLQMSLRQVNRCLVDFYGMSFQQKLTQTRMEQAAWMLCTTDKSINEIAEMVGYDSESGFYKVFRKHYQMTPKQYRKQYAPQDKGT